MKTPANQVCVLVLGMHRSGTSAMTRVLNLHGVALGADLLEPAADNAKGFWEQRAVVEMHERLLAALARTWADPRPLPAGWLQTDAARQAVLEIDAILEEFAGQRIFAIKDPRLCQFVQLWLPSLHARGIHPVVLFVARHPLEVAESIHMRDGWSRELSWLMWSRSTIEAVAATGELQRCVISYDALLGDWRAAVAKVARQLQLDLPVGSAAAAPAVDEFLDLGARHHHRDEIPEPDVPGHLLAIYDALVRIEQGEPWNILEPFAALNEDFKISTVALHEEQARSDSHGLAATRTGGMAQVFYRTSGERHAEERSRALAWPSATNVASFAFQFDETIEIDALRIDFDDSPGIFLLDRLEFDGELMVVPSRVTSGNGMVLGDGLAATVGLVAADNDPWIEVNVAGTRCRTVTVAITRIPLNDALHTLRGTLDVHQRLDTLFQRVANSGDCILANQRAADARSVQAAQETSAAVQALERRMRESAEAASGLGERVNAAAQSLDVLVGGMAALAEAQSHAAAGLEARLAQALDGIHRLEAGLSHATEGLRGLDARLSTGSEKVEAIAAAVLRQRDELHAVSALAQQQGREVEAMAAVLDEINRSRFGWRLRKLFGLPALSKDG